jgi:hypothetical protein
MMCLTCWEPLSESDSVMFAGHCLPCHATTCELDDCVSMSCFEIRWFGILESRS